MRVSESGPWPPLSVNPAFTERFRSLLWNLDEITPTALAR